jgi:hypothetical protein
MQTTLLVAADVPVAGRDRPSRMNNVDELRVSPCHRHRQFANARTT